MSLNYFATAAKVAKGGRNSHQIKFHSIWSTFDQSLSDNTYP